MVCLLFGRDLKREVQSSPIQGIQSGLLANIAAPSLKEFDAKRVTGSSAIIQVPAWNPAEPGRRHICE
jgi:hypothetical protein